MGRAIVRRHARKPLSRPLSGRLTAASWYVRHLASALDFRVLGPFEVFDGGPAAGARRNEAAQRSGDPRAQRGRDRLERPAHRRALGRKAAWDAQTALQQHVSRLRKAVEPHRARHARAGLRPRDRARARRSRALPNARRAGAARARRRRAGRGYRSRGALAASAGQRSPTSRTRPFAVESARVLSERLAALETRIDADLARGQQWSS